LFLRSIRVVWWWCIRFTGWLVVLLNFHDLCPSSSASEVWVVSNPFGVCFVFFRSSLWPQLLVILVSDLDYWREIVVFACCGLYREPLVREIVPCWRSIYFPFWVVKAHTPPFFAIWFCTCMRIRSILLVVCVSLLLFWPLLLFYLLYIHLGDYVI
jgi:hypothetical protein